MPAPAPAGAVPRGPAPPAAAVERRLGARARPPSDDPPLTRFLAEQLATAHWFDQRRTRELLGWAPRVSLDEGLAALAGAFAAQP